MKTYKELSVECRSWNDSEIKGFFGFGEEEYGFLSNFCKTPVLYDGVIYPASENAYMAAKSLDLNIRLQFENISAADAKKIGRSLTLRYDWTFVKKNIMFSIVLDKFSRNQIIRKKLLDTKDKYLEEINWWNDRFWGVDFKSGMGENNLGKILMEVRTILK